MTIRLNKHLGDYIASLSLITGMMIAVLGIATLLSLGQSMLQGHAGTTASVRAAGPLAVSQPAVPARSFAADGGAV